MAWPRFQSAYAADLAAHVPGAGSGGYGSGAARDSIRTQYG